MRESKWTRDFCLKLTEVGCIVIPNVMGPMVRNVPDRTIITKYGMYYVEFKGETTEWEDGQRILAGRINDRFPCCFLYRFPGILSINDQWVSVRDPRQFVEELHRLCGLYMNTKP